MNEQNVVVNENETALQTAPQTDIMPQATQYRSMWNDTEMLSQAWKCACSRNIQRAPRKLPYRSRPCKPKRNVATHGYAEPLYR